MSHNNDRDAADPARSAPIGAGASGRGAATAPVEIDGADLPAFCPNPKMTLWNQHPRVFLDLGPDGAAACPYCGTRYALKAGSKVSGH